MTINANLTVSELMRRYPRTSDVFIKRKMLCVGCPSQNYHTLEEVARIHGYDREDFLECISRTINE